MDISVARTNYYLLKLNHYPGRGIVLGMDETGKYMVQVYWVMGRSPNSRNRRMVQANGTVSTEAVDEAKVEDASLIMYNAMREDGKCFVVSNGSQTDTVLAQIANGKKLGSALAAYKYEPDAPNFTPRITGVCDLDSEWPFSLAILRKSPWDESCQRFCYYYEKIAPSFGLCVTTYSSDGNPLPSFHGEPYVLPLTGDIAEVTNTYWEALNRENRVSLAVRFIALSGQSQIRINNRYQKVS